MVFVKVCRFYSSASISRVAQRVQRGHTTHWTRLTPGLQRSTVETRSVDRQSEGNARQTGLYLQARDALMTVFLPKDWTHTVTPDYMRYTLWQVVNTISGTVAGTLSTQALLQALGLGAATSIGLAVTTNWIIKDGFGLLGGVVFAGMMGNRFDASPKRHRFMASLCIQASNLMELITPLVPSLFLPIASLSNIVKNIGWLAASATRASMHKGFTKTDNLGDITAKAGAQATASGLIGTGLGIGVSWALGTEPAMLMAAFLPLSGLNLLSAYMSNRCVVTRHMNVERAELCFKEILLSGQVLTPAAVARRETMIMPPNKHFSIPLKLEPDISILSHLSVSQLNDFLKSETHSNYCIYASRDKGNRWVALWFLENATAEDVTLGFYKACLVRAEMEAIQTNSKHDVIPELVAAGWDLQHTHLGDRNARINLEY